MPAIRWFLGRCPLRSGTFCKELTLTNVCLLSVISSNYRVHAVDEQHLRSYIATFVLQFQHRYSHAIILMFLLAQYINLNAKFVLKRKIWYYVTASYLLTILLVISSWVGFWVSNASVSDTRPGKLLFPDPLKKGGEIISYMYKTKSYEISLPSTQFRLFLEISKHP